MLETDELSTFFLMDVNMLCNSKLKLPNLFWHSRSELCDLLCSCIAAYDGKLLLVWPRKILRDSQKARPVAGGSAVFHTLHDSRR